MKGGDDSLVEMLQDLEIGCPRSNQETLSDFHVYSRIVGVLTGIVSITTLPRRGV